MANVGNVGSEVKATSIWSSKPTQSSKTAGDDMGKDDFMKLMLTQLQHQDPLKPMDDQAFIAQTAQFNALDEMTKLNATLSAVLDSQQLAEASAMIGKIISASGKDGQEVKGEVTAASVSGGVAMVHVGATRIELDRVTAVASAGEHLPVSDSTATDDDADGATVE